MHPIPPAFAQQTAAVFGTAGQAWLEQLPDLLADCARRWALTVAPPFEPLSYNYVAPARRADGSEVILKLGVPRPEISSEVAALQLAAGQGMAVLQDADPARGILLLERLSPGTPLADLGDDEQATRLAAQVMQQLWQPVPPEHSFPSVADWMRGFTRLRQHYGGGCGPFPAALVAHAEQLAAALGTSAAVPMVLHGDLHHHNILAAQRQPWLAIDPKGLVGDPAYEAGALLRNPLPWLLDQPQPERVLARRVAILSEALAIDRARILGWAIAQTVLSAWWLVEDNAGDPAPTITCAMLMERLEARTPLGA